MERRTYLFILFVVSLPVAYALARIAGLFYSHAQPFAALGFEPLIPHEIDNSFPSDHTALFAVCATVGLLYHRWIGLLLWALTLSIGFIRMYAGLHWSEDVIAGAVIGALAVFISEFVLRLISPLIQR